MTNFEDIKIDDEVVVVVYSSGSRQPDYIGKVTKVCKNYFVVKGIKYQKRNGHQTSSSMYFSNHVLPITPEAKARIRMETIIGNTKYEATHANYKVWSEEDLRTVFTLCKKYKKGGINV